jgi:hypothetical protein
MSEWKPIYTAKEGVLYCVFWKDTDSEDAYDIDFMEEGVWQNYFNRHEHYLIAGAAIGNSEDAPYTHCIELLPPQEQN